MKADSSVSERDGLARTATTLNGRRVLHPQGSNSIVIAVWKIDQSAGSLGDVSLINYGSYKSGLVMPAAAPHVHPK
jgi:hypothetical protein